MGLHKNTVANREKGRHDVDRNDYNEMVRFYMERITGERQPDDLVVVAKSHVLSVRVQEREMYRVTIVTEQAPSGGTTIDIGV